jgi:RHS repeat-associated protein
MVGGPAGKASEPGRVIPYGGTYPGSITASLICAPGKTLTPASPNTCVDMAPAVALTSASSSATYAPGANIPLRATASDNDGTITQVEFFNGTTSLGTATRISGSASNGTWAANVSAGFPAGTYTLTAKATDNASLVTTSAQVTITVDAAAAMTATVAQPQSGGYSAPASIPLTATVATGLGTIDNVTFYAGATPIGQGFLTSGTASSGSYVTNVWTNVPAGTYSITAVATHANGSSITSAAVSYTVGAASSGATTLYFVNADHLGTPRLVENQSQQAVWKWDNAEAFGDSGANENPSSLGVFKFNPRFPGQYADQETGLSYNHFRSYKPEDGRYRESDPTGLAGGLNTYEYALGNPLGLIDPQGLEVPGQGWLAATGYSKPQVPNCSCSNIFSVAKGYIGSEKWNILEISNTCNIGVYDVLDEAGAPAPQRWPQFFPGQYPIGAGGGGWAIRKASYPDGRRQKIPNRAMLLLGTVVPALLTSGS